MRRGLAARASLRMISDGNLSDLAVDVATASREVADPLRPYPCELQLQYKSTYIVANHVSGTVAVGGALPNI